MLAAAGRLGRLAFGDFLDRARRPAYLVVLATAVGLGYLAVPDTDAHWVLMRVGDYRGRYDSAYTGMVTALGAALWLSLGGFYAVRDALARDERTGVGELLAASPLHTAGYLAAKFLGNVLVLASMVGVLAGTALVMQVVRDESSSVDPVALVAPFLLVTLPVVVLTAAMALLSETVPALRGGLGNVVWFFAWLVAVLGGMAPGIPLGGLGVHQPVASMRDDLLAQGGQVSEGDFSLGLTYEETPLRVFDWDGFTPTTGYLLGRATLVLVAVVLVPLPALWFARFDPGRRGGGSGTPAGRHVAPAAPAEGARPVMATAFAGRPRTPVRPGRAGGRLLTGELRILLRGGRWWWLGLAAITAAGALAPLSGVIRFVLPLAWLWPILRWSRLGSQRHEHGVATLLDAYPTPHRRTIAEGLAGVCVAALAGLAPLARLLVAGDWPGVAAWCGGALFVPALALALGTLSRSHRLFQTIYLPLWYVTANGLPFLDFMGACRIDGALAGPSPLLFLASAPLLLVAALATNAARSAAS
ncbi:hypothetical protein [Streptomyces hainanensis]|uniref:Uncharacterized protein n=1 Tax=Streptomyces hainanensis TaxID=402648 RepID=A0A4R4TNJ8_9ACTN|nr:hypothetical protein [Streptomyces hainanensis]TDC77464.1 hypothetical protein E1283_07325 [Streptomyces hainanensis]